jgi:hypothetical protein
MAILYPRQAMTFKRSNKRFSLLITPEKQTQFKRIIHRDTTTKLLLVLLLVTAVSFDLGLRKIDEADDEEVFVPAAVCVAPGDGGGSY